MLETFQKSLPSRRWRPVVLGHLLVAFFLVQPILAFAADRADLLLFKLVDTVDDAQALERLNALVTRMSSAFISLSPETLFELISEAVRMKPLYMVLLLLILTTVIYIVTRPLFSAFRMKRMLFNLSGTGLAPAESSYSWHHPRTTGLYAEERELFYRLGDEPPRERQFDLLIGYVGAALAGWLLLNPLLAPDPQLASEMPSQYWLGLVLTALITIAMVALRVFWLKKTRVARTRDAATVSIPGGSVLPITRQIVERRSILETAGFAAILPASIFVWYRLWLELSHIKNEERILLGGTAIGIRRGVLVLGTILVTIVAVVVLPIGVPLQVYWGRYTSSDYVLQRAAAL